MEENYTVSLAKVIEAFDLETIYLPALPEDIGISCSRVNRPGLQFVGFYDHYEQARIQISRCIVALTPSRSKRAFSALSITSWVTKTSAFPSTSA